MYSARELHNWTFSAESIAACTIHDVLTMTKNTVEDYEFFWLGRIPCRSVKIVGLVVGIQVYERKIIYTVDDGTAVVDCTHPHRPAKPLSEVLSKYRPVDTNTPPETLTPVADIGQTIRVTGTVRLQYHTRIIFINEIDKCASPNEELLHSRFVQELHRLNYSSKEAFVILKPTQNSTHESPNRTTPKPAKSIRDPPASVSYSPVESSPIKPQAERVTSLSPAKFRHPSRLCTHDLTENTFRIYLKNYMDNAANTIESDLTPNVNLILHQWDTDRSTEKPKHEGFTISYLRRVPELSLLAYRVVQAVAKKRERDKRKRLKDAPSSSKRSLPSSTTAPIAPDKLRGKMKRLFEWAIIRLLREGCIILWDGPVRPLPHSKSMTTDTSQLWKKKLNISSVSHADVKIFSSDSRCLDDDDPTSGYISDPQSDEESYISLTPTYLSEHVVQAIHSIVQLQAHKIKPYAGATAESILSFLKKDDRWRNIGLWNVQDALEILTGQGTIWDMGKGRWDLTA